MYKILRRKQLNDTVVLLEIEAPFIAKKAKAGQFIILRIDEYGERMPLTIADTDPEKGSVTIIFQIVGQTTMILSKLNEGDALLDFVGPLGAATELDGVKKACVIGGGVGCAIAYPSAKALFKYEEIFNTMRISKSALLIKRHGQRAVAGAHLQKGIVSRILAHKEVDQRFAVALSLRLRFHGEVLELQNPAALVSDDAFCFHAAVLQHIHGAPLQIAVDHVLLLVCQQQKRKELLFIFMDFSNIHKLLRQTGICFVRLF